MFVYNNKTTYSISADLVCREQIYIISWITHFPLICCVSSSVMLVLITWFVGYFIN